MNGLGISINYDELKRIDCTLTKLLLMGLGEHRVLISNYINKILLHEEMDNFDCIQETKSGTRSSHDTILMVFQNQKEKNDTVVFIPNKDDSKNKRSVDTILECQKILPFRKCSRAETADNFTPGSYKVPENITQLRQEEYNAWCISRHIKPISDSEKK